MPIFVDTSAFYALLSASDEHHEAARSGWSALAAQQPQLVTTNYVLVETLALIGRRLGFEAVRAFQRDFVPILHVVWVSEERHRVAVDALLTAGDRSPSLVDCVSFATMRHPGLE
ncbi:MAG TPA: PIN domain-containing protein, partial [Chloroflexota bacterium]